MDIFVLFLRVKEKLSIFHLYDVSYNFFIDFFYQIENIPFHFWDAFSVFNHESALEFAK